MCIQYIRINNITNKLNSSLPLLKMDKLIILLQFLHHDFPCIYYKTIYQHLSLILIKEIQRDKKRRQISFLLSNQFHEYFDFFSHLGVFVFVFLFLIHCFHFFLYLFLHSIWHLFLISNLSLSLIKRMKKKQRRKQCSERNKVVAGYDKLMVMKNPQGLSLSEEKQRKGSERYKNQKNTKKRKKKNNDLKNNKLN